MKTRDRAFASCLLAVAICGSSTCAYGQATTQIIDFLLPEMAEPPQPDGTPSNGFAEAETFSLQSRTLTGFEGTALEGLTTTFTGLSQVAQGEVDGFVPDNNGGSNCCEDFRLRAITQTSTGVPLDATIISNPTRFANQPVTTDLNAELLPRAGALQWAIDLSPLETYLSQQGQTLTALEVNLDLRLQGIRVPESPGSGLLYDLLMSYTNPAENIELTDISTEVSPDFAGSQSNGLLWAASVIAGDGQFITAPTAAAGSPADFNEDGIVDAVDYAVWRENLGDGNPSGDANGDGDTNSTDFGIWVSEFGASGGGTSSFTHFVIDSQVNNSGDPIFPSTDNLTTVDLLALFNAGVREFNFSLLTAGFGPNGRSVGVLGPGFSNDGPAPGTGVFISTSSGSVAIPEPTAILCVFFGTALLCGFGAKRGNR